MTSEEFVKSKKPNAECEKHGKYYYIRVGNNYITSGRTVTNAWKNAKNCIKKTVSKK